MSRRVRVHHFVVARVVKPQSQTWRASDLFGASHWLDVPADTEFPYTVPQLSLFTRFYLDRAKPTNFRARIWWRDHPSGIPEEVGTFGTFQVPFVPTEGVRDRSFNLHNIRLLGVGEHTIELLREKIVENDENEWLPIAWTYFYVEREP